MSSDKGAECRSELDSLKIIQNQPVSDLTKNPTGPNLMSCLVFLKKKKVARALRAEPAALDVDTFTNPL